MKKLGVGIFGLGLTSLVTLASANAADMYAGGMKDGPGYYPVTSWTGFYTGLHVGGAWSDLDVTDDNRYASGATPGTKTHMSPSGVFGGITSGYNYQIGHFVLGIESDDGFMDISSKRLLTGTGSGTKVGLDSGFYSDFTGRLGYACDRSLFYVKGGLAVFDGEDKFSTVTGSFSGKSSTDPFWGWTVGAGVEYMLNPVWSIKAEYQHIDLGSQDFTVFNVGGTPFRFTDDLTIDTVKVGVNYHTGQSFLPF